MPPKLAEVTPMQSGTCEVPTCREPVAFRLQFTGSDTPGLDYLDLCKRHSEETKTAYAKGE